MKISVGMKIEVLLILELTQERNNGARVWKTKCSCGEIRNYRSDEIKRRSSQDCTCSRISKEIKVGYIFSRLTVVKLLAERYREQKVWECICVCGNKVKVTTGNLNSGHTTSCGCYNREQTSLSNKKHGYYKTGLYRIWSGMKQRCDNPNSTAFKNYGGRGIRYHPSFETFEGFLSGIPDGYSPGLEIDRIDNDGNYEPGNLRWATVLEQANNKRNTVFVEDPETGEK